MPTIALVSVPTIVLAIAIGSAVVGIILVLTIGANNIKAPPLWVLCLCAIPVSIVAMVCTIWGLRHGYLSAATRDRTESKIILYGLLAPFLAVLMAIIAFFMRKNPKE